MMEQEKKWVPTMYNDSYDANEDGEIRSRLGEHPQVLRPGFYRNGYTHVGLQHKHYTVHKLVWTAFNGPVPKGYVIDHINNNRADNRLCNLQLLTNAENVQKGMYIHRNKTSKYPGVCQNAKTGKWMCHLTVDKKRWRFAWFDTEEEAWQARCDAKAGKLKPLSLRKIEDQYAIPRRHKSKYSDHPGVTYDKIHNRWLSYINKCKIGNFDTEAEAAKAYDDVVSGVIEHPKDRKKKLI